MASILEFYLMVLFIVMFIQLVSHMKHGKPIFMFLEKIM